MELDDLKHIWQQNQELSVKQQEVDNEKVMDMTRQKSKDLMTKLRANLKLDAVVSSTFIPPLIYVLFVKNIATYHKYIAVFFYRLYLRRIILLSERNQVLQRVKFEK